MSRAITARGPLGEAATGDLAAHDGELDSEGEDLGGLGHSVDPVHPDALEYDTDEAIQEADHQGGRHRPAVSQLAKFGLPDVGPFRQTEEPPLSGNRREE